MTLLAIVLASALAAPVEPVAVFDQPGWCNWCPSPVALPDGRVALASSRWPTSVGFRAWSVRSEIALAISEKGPLGPYSFVGTILPPSGREGSFDRDVTHNPCLFVDGGKFYLYYMGTTSGTNALSADPVGSVGHRYCLNHQLVGVAVADRVEGPYRRTGRPLFTPEPGVGMSNPAICRRPDGRYLMLVKWWTRATDGLDDHVAIFAALGDTPLGPFKIVKRDVFPVPGVRFPGEDPYLWVEGDVICCAIHDMARHYSKELCALIRFESRDGIDWTNKGVLFPRGSISRLERPAVYCGPDGSRLLFAASKPKDKDHNSLIVAYPGVLKPAKTSR